MNDKQERINKILTLDVYDKIDIVGTTKRKVNLDKHLRNYLEERDSSELDVILQKYFTSAELINDGLF